MEFCKNCGALLPENATACPVCGTAVAETVAPGDTAPVVETTPSEPAQPPQAPRYAPQGEPFAGAGAPPHAPEPPRPEGAPAGENGGQPQGGQPRYQPGGPAYYQPQPPQSGLSTAGYLGTLLLFMIPLVGFILMLVWSFSENVSPERQKLSRAYLLRAVILAGLAIVVAVIALFGIAGAGFYGMRHGYWY